MNERAGFFGKDRSIFGIVTEAEGSAASVEKPAILLLNAGLMHHVGPFRMYVVLARALARLGFTVLRFDLSSKGDSPPRPGALSYRESVRADVAEAMDFLAQSRGVRNFVLLGLCSGAGDAFECGIDDDRVSGLVLLDGYAYRTSGFYRRHYLPRLLDAAKWPAFAGRLVKRLAGTRGGGDDLREDVYGMAFPAKEVFRGGLEKMLARNAVVLIVHTGGWFGYYNDANQFREAFPHLAQHPGIAVHYFGKADHTYTIVSDRKALIELVCNWAVAQWPLRELPGARAYGCG